MGLPKSQGVRGAGSFNFKNEKANFKKLRLSRRRQLVMAVRSLIEPLEIRTLLSYAYLPVDAGSGSFCIRRSGNTEQVFGNQPVNTTPILSIPISSDEGLDIYGSSGNDTITVDYAGGDPIVGGLYLNGETATGNSGDTLNIINTGGANYVLNGAELSIGVGTANDLISFDTGLIANFNLFDPDTSNQLAVDSGSTTFSADIGGNGASVSMTVNAGASVAFGATQHLQSLTIAHNGSVSMLPAGGQALVTTSLTVSGKLDLANNDLIVTAPTSTARTTLQEQVAAGVNATATQGIIFSSTAATDGMTLGVAPASDIALTTLDGQNIPSTALVARYTLPGDANLDGIVNSTDLGILAHNFGEVTGTTPPMWYQADFNYDGYVNSLDLGEMSFNFGQESVAMPVTVYVGTPYTVVLPASTSVGTPARFDVNWGDGGIDIYSAGTASASHTYTSAGPANIQLSILTSTGAVFHAPATPVAVTATTGLMPYSLAASADDAINIAANGSGGTIITDNDVAVESIPTTDLLSLNITGDTDGTLTVDFSNGNPLPPSGLFADSQTIDVNGSTSSDTLFTTATAAMFNNTAVNDAEIRHLSSAAVTFLNAGAGDQIVAIAGAVTVAGDTSNNGAGSVNGGPSVLVDTAATVLFTGTQHLSALNILPGGTARMVEDGTVVLVTGSLNISAATSTQSGGQLDLADNDLIVNDGTLTNLPAIAGFLANGYDDGAWDAEGDWPYIEPAAITSSMALGDQAMIEALGYAQIGSGQGQLNLSSFDNQPVSTGDVVVKYTYYGDANLDGTVNAADQTAIASGLTNHLTGWSNGDFTYTGSVSAIDSQWWAKVQAMSLPPGSLTLAADSDVPTTILPTTTPTGAAISSWDINWGTGQGPIPFDPNDPASWPISNTELFHAVFTPLDASENRLYYYPATNIQLTEPAGAITGGPNTEVRVNNINATATQFFNGVVATFVSSDPEATIADYTATIEWGDGNSTAGTIASLGGLLYSVTGSYTYKTPDVAPLIVEIDNGSGDPATALGTATISDDLTIGTPASATLESDNMTVDLSALGNDAAGPDQLTYT